MAKTKEQLETELTAATTRISELEQQLAAGGNDHTACQQTLAGMTAQRDSAIADVQRLSQLLEQGATASLGDGVEIVQLRDCGAVLAGTRLAVVLLTPGIDMNFVVDAVRSGIARVNDVPSIEDEQVDADA